MGRRRAAQARSWYANGNLCKVGTAVATRRTRRPVAANSANTGVGETFELFAEINSNLVGVEIEDDLSRPRKESLLRKFLEEAEQIIEAMVQQAGQP